MGKTALIPVVGAVLAALVFSTAGVALAHTMVRSTSISEGARLEVSPPSVTIRFEHAAGMGSVQLATATGERVPLSYTPPRAMSDAFVIPLPRLEPDRYRLSWRVIADDGHVMAGALNFTVTGPASRPAPTRRP
jgi:copper resistance protein C